MKNYDEIDWWHRISLPDGRITPGRQETKGKLRTLDLPLSFSGKSVIDIGAWDGFFSFEAEKRGAKDVLAVDQAYKFPGGRDGIDYAREELGSRVRILPLSVYELDPREQGVFDYAFFFGVLYHLKHPLFGLEKVAAVGRTIILETTIDAGQYDVPVLEFNEFGKYGDPTNWSSFNESCLLAMMRSAGMGNIERTYINARGDRAVYRAQGNC